MEKLTHKIEVSNGINKIVMTGFWAWFFYIDCILVIINIILKLIHYFLK